MDAVLSDRCLQRRTLAELISMAETELGREDPDKALLVAVLKLLETTMKDIGDLDAKINDFMKDEEDEDKLEKEMDEVMDTEGQFLYMQIRILHVLTPPAREATIVVADSPHRYISRGGPTGLSGGW